MVKISPIKGITYNLDKININNVVAPPYDVISDEDREKLYQASEYNIVKLILGKTSSSDSESDNQYTRASAYFSEWLNSNVLLKSEKPCIYYYIQNYTTPKGELVSRKGFIAKTLIQEYSQNTILPHEYTMGGPKEDRLKLMKACNANFSQIFMLYSDPEHKIDKAIELKQTPDIDVTDPQGVRNIVYIIDNPEIIENITALMNDKTLLIADGHHRYETSIAYRDFMRANNPDYSENDDFNWVMCYYTNLDDENLHVYPTHRIIEKETDIDALFDNLRKYFDITEFEFDKSNKEQVKADFTKKLEEAYKNNIAFGIYIKNINKYFLAELREKEAVNKILDEKEVPEELKVLDLSALHKIVITDFIGISPEDQTKQIGVKYIKKEEEAIEAVENNTAELVFLMASPKIQDIKDISNAGYKMPQKSTYFYPKLLSGLVINPLQ
ncbi:MAG: DUF1015 domain-containing protein [Ignavibacteriales bacterium]|nr:DUF1015 domain-containing protein [Ignavibacteriales bacterium]